MSVHFTKRFGVASLIVLFLSVCAWADADELAPAPPPLDMDNIPSAEAPPAPPSKEISPPPVVTEAPKDDLKELPVITPEVQPAPQKQKEEQASLPPPATDSSSNAPTNSSTAEYGDIRTPRYTHLRPNWGSEISGSMASLGTSSASTQIPNLGGHKISSGRMAFEYEFPFLQKFGVLGAGVTGSMYMGGKHAGISDARFAFWSAGVQARYQGRWFYQQPLVPYAGVSYEHLAYHLHGYAGSTGMTGVFAGGMLYLNIFEPSAAADFYSGMGVLRTYLIGEIRTETAKANGIAIGGKSIFAGFRFEN